MQYRFERLEIWKQAREFCSNVYGITKGAALHCCHFDSSTLFEGGEIL